MSTGDLSVSQSYQIEGALDSLFALEPALIARIADQVAGFETVSSSSLVAGSRSLSDLLPACFVEPGPGTRNTTGEGYGIGSLKQSWSVMIVVTHYMSAVGDSSAAQLAGGLALQTIEALDGWTPSDYIEPLAFTGHADPVSGAGWAAFDLTFETELTL